MTNDDHHDIALRALISDIETSLGWGHGLNWSTRDFEQLSAKIHERTGVQLSVVTLKRVWKKIEYSGKPTITTLNALAVFGGAQNWQAFKQLQLVKDEARTAGVNASVTSDVVRRANKFWPSRVVIWIALIACTGSVIFYVSAFRLSGAKRSKNYTFSSKKVVDTGVPNTVIFDYDVSSADKDDSVSIQQSWDPRLSMVIDPHLKQFTSIYYHPGFFDARLKVNYEVVKKHSLLIKSNGWLPLLDTTPTPIYFETDDALQDGRLGLPIERIRNTGIVLQPEPPWCSYYKVGDLPEINSDDFVFETRVRNDFGEGGAACRYTELHILFEGAAMVLPLSVPGCVSTLEFYDDKGKLSDTSVLGVNLADWVDLRFEIADTLANMYINNKKAFDLTTQLKAVPWVGMIFKFRGTGSVDYIRVSRKKSGKVVYEESF